MNTTTERPATTALRWILWVVLVIAGSATAGMVLGALSPWPILNTTSIAVGVCSVLVMFTRPRRR